MPPRVQWMVDRFEKSVTVGIGGAGWLHSLSEDP